MHVSREKSVNGQSQGLTVKNVRDQSQELTEAIVNGQNQELTVTQTGIPTGIMAGSTAIAEVILTATGGPEVTTVALPTIQAGVVLEAQTALREEGKK